MEVLFSDSLASLEAYVILACIVIFVALYFYDGYDFVKRIFTIISRKNEYKNTPDEKEGGQHEAVYAPENQEESLLPLEKNEEGVPTLTIEDEETGRRIEVASPFLENITPEEVKEHISTREKEKEQEETMVVEQNFSEESVKSLPEAEVSSAEEENISETGGEEQEQKNEVAQSSNEEVAEEEVGEIQGEVLPESSKEDSEISKSQQEEKDRVEDISQESNETFEEKEESNDLQEEKTLHQKERNSSSGSNTTEVLFGLTNQVRTAVARGQILEARGLIIQGLALEKNHRDLNLILAELYENEKQFEKAEYIYKDLALVYQNDGEILEKLANVLIIQRRYDVAREIYKQLVEMTGETEGSLYILTHLSSEIGDAEEKYTYARKYQKNWPNNPEILTLLAQAEISLGKRRDAIETLKRLKNLTPYNNEILETIQKLVLEEELAGNFGN